MARSPSASAPTSATADDAYFVPVGISLGRRFELEGSNTTFVPYAHPVIVPVFGGGDSDVNFALGLGVDIRFSEQLGHPRERRPGRHRRRRRQRRVHPLTLVADRNARPRTSATGRSRWRPARLTSREAPE